MISVIAPLPLLPPAVSKRFRISFRKTNPPNCRGRLKGWLENVAARSSSWGDVDLKAFCKETGYSREHATRQLSVLRKEGQLVFETKIRIPKGKGRKRWGVMVAHPKKLRFDGHSLFFGRDGKALHNYTTLGDGGEKLTPTDFIPKPRRPRGRPRKIVEAPPGGVAQDILGHVQTSVEMPVNSVFQTKKYSVCDIPNREDYFVIQQSDLYGAGRSVAQWRGSGSGERRLKTGALNRKAFAVLRPLQEQHWDNCKVTFSRRCAYSYALGALTNGHTVERIVSCYSDALYVTHGFAVDRAASAGKIVFFNLSSTVVKARKLLDNDGLNRSERMALWYRNHEVDKDEITKAFQELAQRIGAYDSQDEVRDDQSTGALGASGDAGFTHELERVPDVRGCPALADCLRTVCPQ